MPATGARRGHLVYHWKHGWIPLDHFAALSKAHHSKSGAVKVMQKHGIEVPKGYSSDHKGKPSAIHARRAETQRSQEAHLRAGAVAHGLKKPQPSAGDLSDAAAQWKRENPGKTIAGHEREVSRIADRLAERKFIDKNSTGDTAAQHAAERERIKKAAAIVGGSQSMLNRLVAEKHAGDHITLYHGTHARHVEGIKRDGLKQAMNGTAQSYTLTTSKKQAEGYAAGHGKDAAVVEFHVPKSEVRKIGVNNDAALWNTTTQHNVYGETGTAYALRRTLPAKYVAKVHGSDTPSPAAAHPAPHTLKLGDHATVHGIDEHGAPIHFTGEVRGTTAVTMSKGGKKTPMLGITVKRESPTTGAMRHDTVYVPDPNRDPAKIDAARKAGAERDQFRRDLNAKYAGKGASYMQQRHGIDPAAMNTTDLAKYHKSLQAEHDSVLLSDGKKLRDAMAAEHAKRGTEARVRSLPPEGKFGGVHSETHMGEKITVRKGREWGTLRTEINGQHVGTPYGTKNSDAVKELDSLKATVAHAKANPESYTNGAGEASYGMKLGAKISPTPTHSAGMDPHAARATQLREAAAKKRAEAERIAGSVGAPDRAGAMLRAKDSARMNARMDSGLRRFTEKQREAKALESKAHLADARSEALQQKQEAANLGMTASKLSPGDLIQHKGQAHMVTKVNRTTVSVPSIVGGSWEDKVPVAGIGKHVKVADMKESTLRTLMSRAKGNASLQAVYAAELKRRGLSV